MRIDTVALTLYSLLLILLAFTISIDVYCAITSCYREISATQYIWFKGCIAASYLVGISLIAYLSGMIFIEEDFSPIGGQHI